MHHGSRLLAMLSLAFMPTLPASSWAVEVLEFTSGSIMQFRTGDALFDFRGPRGSLRIYGESGLGVRGCIDTWPGIACFSAGEHQLGGYIKDIWIGGATVDGSSNAVGGAGYLADSLIFNVNALGTIPELGTLTQTVVTGTFELTGTLLHTVCRPFAMGACQAPLFPPTLYELQGHGVFTLPLHRASFGPLEFWKADGAIFEVVPEPATLLLFGTSAAGLGLARLTRRRRNALRRGEGLSRASKS
jgi:hypothetical protein